MFKANKYFLIVLCLLSSPLQALDFQLSIQPVLPRAQILEAYQPLAEYLSELSGHNITVKAHHNFISYWSDMRLNRGFDLVLDAAHFTDYRIQRKNYEVLAKLPDTVSFSVVTHEDDTIFEMEELVLKRVATMVSPSVGGIRLMNWFDDPLRQPRIVYARDSNDAANLVQKRKVFAAIIPTALVGGFEGLYTVDTAEPLPHMGFSASPEVPAEVKSAIKQALITAKDTPRGQEMLSKINFAEFVDTSAAEYKGHERLLRNVLGY